MKLQIGNSQLVNFFAVGAAKSGTTALYDYFSQHAEVCVSRPNKEPHYFAYKDKQPDFVGPGDKLQSDRMFELSEMGYLQSFSRAHRFRIYADFSTMYLYEEQAARNIYEYNSQAKILICLRNPISRCYSAWAHMRRDGREPESDFSEALKLEETRIMQNWMPCWHYVASSMYSKQIKRYLELFPQKNIKVILFEDLIKNSHAVLADLCDFLEVRFDSTIELPKSNISYEPKSALVQKFLKRGGGKSRQLIRSVIPAGVKQLALSLNRGQKITLQPAQYAELRELFALDVEECQRLLQRDLSIWS